MSLPDWTTDSESTAIAQRSLADPAIVYDLYPPLLRGCPQSSDEETAYPLEVDYDYERVDPAIFEQPALPGLTRWAPLLPPLLPGLSMGEGGTPLVEDAGLAAWAGHDGRVFVKDESRNPTWSHKDRLNLCGVSAAAAMGARGIAVASSGNHGAAAAAYAARAGLPCVVVGTHAMPRAFQNFIRAYGAILLPVAMERRWPVLNRIVDEFGYYPVSNLTETGHTGHPFGPEGYKPIAYEIVAARGGSVPDAVIVPTGYAELLYGVCKGFRELKRFGRIDRLPRLIAVEPETRGPLRHAVAAGTPFAKVAAGPTAAAGIGSLVSGYRGVLALRETDGRAVGVSDAEMHEAAAALGRRGLWQEICGAAAPAALRRLVSEGGAPGGDVVLILTSSGFKDLPDDAAAIPDLVDDEAAIAAFRAARPD